MFATKRKLKCNKKYCLFHKNLYLGTALVVQWLTLYPPLQGVGGQFLVWEEAKIPYASGPENQNIKQKQYCNKFNKGF